MTTTEFFAGHLIRDKNSIEIMRMILSNVDENCELRKVVIVVVESVLHYFISVATHYFDRIYFGINCAHILSANLSWETVEDFFNIITAANNVDIEEVLLGNKMSTEKIDDGVISEIYTSKEYPFISKSSFFGSSFHMIPLFHQSHLYYLIKTVRRDLQSKCPWQSALICELFILGYILSGQYKTNQLMFTNGISKGLKRALCNLLCAFNCEKKWVLCKSFIPSMALKQFTHEERLISSLCKFSYL